MRRLPLGSAGLQVSAFALGCLNFGSKTDKITSYRLLDHYRDAGGTFLDTANNYAFWNKGCVGGESELLLGQWMRERHNRSHMFVATKVGAKPRFPGGGFENKEGLGRKAIEQAIDASLQRLGTDYVDLYYAHIDDVHTSLEETLETFDSLVRSGKVRAVGCSNYQLSRVIEASNISREKNIVSYSCIQQRYTYLHPKSDADFGIQVSADVELLEYCSRNKDIVMLAYSPLLHGAYTRQNEAFPIAYEHPSTQKRLSVLKEVATEVGGTLNQIILAWMLQHSPPTIPVIAASSSKQLQENLDSLTLHLSQEQMHRLHQA
ncbi:aldo/keto reductase [Brevibacillus reuszeri]|uniref:aldo/keto reductase n=1 Tax=Brevibacillus reuszeri TaxID=54915 RepID=UPI0028A05FF7|nr:aldo/keto reductase [Brevibacillus reuszeri]